MAYTDNGCKSSVEEQVRCQPKMVGQQGAGAISIACQHSILDVAMLGLYVPRGIGKRFRQMTIAFALYVKHVANSQQPDVPAGVYQGMVKGSMRGGPSVAVVMAPWIVGLRLRRPAQLVIRRDDGRFPLNASIRDRLFKAERFDFDTRVREIS